MKLYSECSGFYTFDLTYHSVLDDELKELVAHTFNPTTLHIRGKSDRIAIHYEYPISFKWESKTHESSKHHDMTLELLPLAQHIRNCAMGVRCLYGYRSPYDGRDYGFWAKETPRPRVVMIPTNRWTKEGVEYFKSIAELVFDPKTIKYISVSRGSGDPFVIIDKEEKEKMADWKDLIDREIDKDDQ